MNSNIENLFCGPDLSVVEVFNIMSNASGKSLPGGIALVVDQNKVLLGTITDGDIRRAISKANSLDLKAIDCMQKDPILFQDKLPLDHVLDQLPIELSNRQRKSSKFLSKIIFVNELRQVTRVLDYHQLWEQKTASHRHLVVIGLGYVGLTMAVVMADAGFLVTGVDVDQSRIETLNQGKSYIHELGLEELVKEQVGKNFRVSTKMPDDGDVFIISVGTPVVEFPNKRKEPILDYLKQAAETIGSRLKRGNLVILRSTVPIGTCRELVLPILEKESGLICGVDFHLSFAPERTAEGKALKELRSLPQIIGGYNKESLEATAALFRDLTPTIVKVDSLEAAEMAKLINNTFRDYVFAYSNRLAQIASKFNLNVVSVIKAANEGYVRDPVPYPSPGVGGPCLTKDPYIFANVADRFDLSNEIFIQGRKINESMHHFVFDSVKESLEKLGKKVEGAKVLFCGLAFKGYPETGDIRNSSAIEVADIFKKNGAIVCGYDPIAESREILELGLEPVSIPEAFKEKDVVLFLNNHKSFEKLNVFEMVRAMNETPIVYDGWAIFRDEEITQTRPCVYLGISYSKTSI
jgi:UDP-N-acetyl-D-mannosaminuronic acid dehydrogenase